MADWYGVPLRRLLRSAERFRDKAIRCGSPDLKTDFSRSRALLCLVTSADQRPDFAVLSRAAALRPLGLLGLRRLLLFLRAVPFRRAVAMSLSSGCTRRPSTRVPSTVSLEELHFALVLLRRRARPEGAEIP